VYKLQKTVNGPFSKGGFMSLKPTDVLQALGMLQRTGRCSKAGELQRTGFADVLAAVSSGASVDGRALGELCRLEMMRSSVAFVADQDLEQSFPLPLSSLSSYTASSQRNDLPPTAATFSQPQVPAQTDTLVTDIAHRAAQRYGVDPALVKAVIKAESDFDPSVESKAGAQGLMQLMPGTASDLGVSDPFDPEQNVMGGTRYLKQLLNKYDGDLDKTLAAYNWGPGNVDRKGIDILPDETRTYLSRVKRFQSEFRA
jgi:soluble lytic murein transglycosylase-like protein